MVFIALSGCAPKYSVHTGRSPVALQWPFAPAKARVTYVESIYGFSRGANTRTILNAITGSTDKDNDAFLLPVAMATGADGRMAVVDMGRKCVHLYLPVQKNYIRIYGSGAEKFISPVDVVFDDQMSLYVSDSTGKIFVFDPGGKFMATWKKAGVEPLQRPTGITYVPSEKSVYVVDTLANRIYAFNAEGTVSKSFGQRGDQDGQFNFPTQLFASADGKLYVTDSLNFRIQILDTSGTFLSMFGHHGDGSGDLAMPKGVAVDPAGVIYVVDSLFDNVQLFNEQGEFLLTVGGRGVNFGEFWLPSGAYIDAGRKLYVCDTYNHRVQIFQIAE